MLTCTRRLTFCYGHRIVGHENKCSTLHGHNAVIEIHATPLGQLDNLGRVIDFSVLKEQIGAWLETHWDHTMLLWERDEETIELIRIAPQKKPPFVLPCNPTAENLADYLLRTVSPQLLKGRGIIVHRVVFWETENCSAEASLDPTDTATRSLYETAEK